MSIKKRFSRILRKPTPTLDTSTASSSSSLESTHDPLPSPAITAVKSAPASTPSSRPGFQRHLHVVRTLTTWTSRSKTSSSSPSEKSSLWSRKNKPRKLSAKQKGKAPEEWKPGQHPEGRPLNEMNLEHQEVLGRWSWAAAAREGSSGSESGGVSPGTSAASPGGSMRVGG